MGSSAAAASFKEGNLIDGLISAMRVLVRGSLAPLVAWPKKRAGDPHGITGSRKLAASLICVVPLGDGQQLFTNR